MNPNFNLLTGSVGFILAEAVGFEPTNELPRYRISSAGRYDHFDTLPDRFVVLRVALTRIQHILLGYYSTLFGILQQILSCCFCGEDFKCVSRLILSPIRIIIIP